MDLGKQVDRAKEPDTNYHDKMLVHAPQKVGEVVYSKLFIHLQNVKYYSEISLGCSHYDLPVL